MFELDSFCSSPEGPGDAGAVRAWRASADEDDGLLFWVSGRSVGLLRSRR